MPSPGIGPQPKMKICDIGTSSTGLVDLGNAEDGIQLEFGASNNTIGSLSAGGRNIIAGNNNAGISVDGATTSSNTIIGNYVGLGADGSTDLGNTHDGVHLQAATGTLIGGTTSSASLFSLGSGTFTRPVLGSIVQKR